MSARTRFLAESANGRTHRSAPTRGGEVFRTNGNWRRTEAFPNGAGRSPPPTREPEQGGASRTAGCAWGVASASQIPKRNLGCQSWSPRLTEATQVVPSEGPMYLRHGFRQPNFVPKFRASVMGVGPYAPRGDEGRHAVPRAWPPPTKFRDGIWGVGQVVVPYGWLRRAAAIALASGAQRSVCASGRKEMGGKRSRNHPQGVQQPRTIPQSACG